MHHLGIARRSLLTSPSFYYYEFMRKEAQGRSILPLRTLQMTCDVYSQELFLVGDILVIMDLT